MSEIKGSTDSREISNEIKDSAKIQAYKSMEMKINVEISLKRDNCC